MPTSIQDEGIALTPRTAMNFVGPGVTVTDDAINSRTVITIPGGGGGGSQTPWTSDIDANDFRLTNVGNIVAGSDQRQLLNFTMVQMMSQSSGASPNLRLVNDAGQLAQWSLGSSAVGASPSTDFIAPFDSVFFSAGSERFRVKSSGIGVTGDSDITGVYRVNGVPIVTGVSSVFGRTGPVTAQSGDYTVSQITGAAADPTTTKADLIVRATSALSRLGVGADGTVLTANAAQPLGMSWVAPAVGGSQTPWTSNIDGAGFALSNASRIALESTTGSTATLTVNRNQTDSGPILSIGKGSTVFNFSRSNSLGSLSIQGTQAGFSNIILCPTDGRVGIGQPTPNWVLDVVGDINIVGFGKFFRINDTPIVLGHTILDESSTMTARAGLNFVGAGVTVTDDSGTNRTVVTIPSWPQTPWTSDIAAAGFKLNNVGQVNIQSATGVATKLNLLQAATASWDIQVPASVNALTFAQGGTEFVRIDATGNVGIGNAGVGVFSAAGFLHTIVGSTTGSATGVLSVAFNNASGGAGILTFANFARSGSDKRIAQISGDWDGSSDSGRMSFLSWSLGSANEVMRLTSSKHAFISGPTAGPTTSVLPNNMLAIWMDEAAGKFTITGKTSAGVVKTATLTWA